jgi:phosphatidylinositol alpha-mannosyltransferase
MHEPVLWLPVVLSNPSEAAMVGTFHASGDLGQLGQLAQPMFADLLTRLDATVAVSRAAADFAASYGLAPDHIIPNGVDVRSFGARHPAERPTILFFSRLDERKGIDSLLRAMPAVAAAIPRVQLIVAGNFALDDPRALHFQELANQLGVNSHFIASPSTPEKTRLFASATVLCAPAYGQESFGIVLAEALAAGLPIVASDLKGFREVLDDGELGVLVAPRDEPALACAMRRVLEDEPLRQRLSEAGLRKARGTLAWDVVATRILEVYDSALAPSAAAA